MQFAKDYNPTLPAFLKFWESKLKDVCIPATKVDGIRILTIHKSKGLQFHTVLMPYCDWPLEKDRNSDILWCEPAVEPFNELPLVPIQSKLSAAQSIYTNDYSEEHRLRRVENINLLYVATTRAEKNLLIWGLESGDNKKGTIIKDTVADVLKNTLPMELNEMTTSETPPGSGEDAPGADSATCLPSVQFSYGEPICKITTKEPSENVIGVAMQSYPCNVEFRQSNPSQEFIKHIDDSEEPSTDYIQQGRLLHRLFSTIHTRDEIDQMLQQFEADGLLDSMLSKKKLRDLIDRGLSNSTVADWFDPRWTVSNECSIVSIDPTTNELCTRRPDRVLVSEGNVTIIDFKFGKPNPAHKMQVSEYMRLISEMNPTKKIEGYLWYVYNNKIEEVLP
jgi:ATP-dependent exoDNAse (exonuclease V) beta subunit